MLQAHAELEELQLQLLSLSRTVTWKLRLRHPYRNSFDENLDWYTISLLMHYHHLVLRCLAITALPCVVHAGHVLPPTISLKGIHDASDVQSLYNVLESTVDLDPNIFGSGARISHVSFSNSTDDILRPGFV